MNTYTETPKSILSLMGKDEKVTNAIAYSHQVCDKNGSFLHFCALLYPFRYIITKSQKEQAELLLKKMKKEKLNLIKNKLVFVGMGMDYVPKYDGDPANHRIRTEIINPEGKKFFIEVGTGRGDTMRIDHVIDMDQQKEFELKREEYFNKIQDAGGFYKIDKSHYLRQEFEKYSQQPFYHFKRKEWESLNVQYNKNNIIKLVNSLFDCNFIEMEVDEYLLTTDDYKSISI